jgi:hypothetical protein
VLNEAGTKPTTGSNSTLVGENTHIEAQAEALASHVGRKASANLKMTSDCPEAGKHAG